MPLATARDLFPQLHPPAMPEFKRPDPARAVEPNRQKNIVITLDSSAAEAGSTFDNAVFNLKQAPWLLPTNLDLAPQHWELRMANFSFAATGAAAPLIAEVRLDGGLPQMESYHAVRQGCSDVVGVVNGTTTALQSGSAGSWPISMTKPLSNRVRVKFQQVGSAADGVPAWAGVTSPSWTLTLIMTPVC